MNSRKTILYILLLALGVILGYNYFIAPVLTQNSNRMGMGMHWHTYGNHYFVDYRFVLIIIVIIAGLLLFEFFKPQNKTNRCGQCGTEIENRSWKICPRCGTPVNDRKG